MGSALSFTATLWRHAGQGGWHFLTLPPDAAEQVEQARERAGGGAGFGSVPVEVSVGDSTWRTSVFPDTRTGSFLLPVKSAVRAREGLEEGDPVAVQLVPHPA